MAPDTALDTATVQEVAGQVARAVAGLIEAEMLQWGMQGGRDLAHVEQWVQSVVGQVGRLLTQGCVQVVRAESEGPRECACGARMHSLGMRERRVVTVVGEVPLRRRYYQCRECGARTHPADAALGLDGGMTSPGVRAALGLFAALLPLRRAVQALGLVGPLRLSATTCRRVARALGERAQGQEVPRQAPALARGEKLYVAMDGTCVWTQEGWREAKAAVYYQVKPGADGELEAARHPSYVAGLEAAEAFGQRVYEEGQWRGVASGRLRGALGDGAAWIWNQVELHFPGAVQVVDWYHASERIKAVGMAVYGEGTARCTQWVEERLDALWEQGPAPVRRSLERLRPAGREAQEVVRQASVYFRNNAARMQYPQLRRRRHPVGSGPVETACKYLIGARCKQPGMRWSLRGLKAILCLRTAFFNDCYEELIRALPAAA